MLLSVNHLSYAIGDKTLFHDISMILEDRDHLALVGRNGSGKSTLLRMIAQREGDITYKKDLKLSYLPQIPSFDNELTVFEQAKKLMPDAEDYAIKASLTRFGLHDMKTKVATLSGGQKKRLNLACVLLADCDLLILDEPTNHLDTEMIEYLEKFLKKWTKGLLMVTHDRYFLERVATRIVELDHGQLYNYQGNYEQFLTQKEEREALALTSQHKRERLLKKELEWIRAGTQARSTKQKSRIQRFEKLAQEEKIKEQGQVKLIDTTSRLGHKTIKLDQISMSFGEHLLFRPFSYLFKRYDRVGILGSNGCGKSTLMNIIAGEIKATQGTVIYGSTIKIGYFEQGVEKMDPSMRVIDYIRATSDALETSEGTLTARNMCERFLFSGDDQYTKIGRLSGGERRRLYLLKVLMSAPNVLLLDEPTNDMDIETVSILEDYLDDFKGIIVAVSHDRYFLDRIADGLFVFKDQEISYVNGGYSNNLINTETKAKSPSNKQNYREENRKKRKRKLTFKEEKELEKLTEGIPNLEKKIKESSDAMSDLTDFSKITELTQQVNALEEQLDTDNERYLELLEIAEA